MKSKDIIVNNEISIGDGICVTPVAHTPSENRDQIDYSVIKYNNNNDNQTNVIQSEEQQQQQLHFFKTNSIGQSSYTVKGISISPKLQGSLPTINLGEIQHKTTLNTTNNNAYIQSSQHGITNVSNENMVNQYICSESSLELNLEQEIWCAPETNANSFVSKLNQSMDTQNDDDDINDFR